MGDDQNLSLAVIFYQIVVIRNDIVNTEKVFLRKTNTRIDNQYLILVFKAYFEKNKRVLLLIFPCKRMSFSYSTFSVIRKCSFLSIIQ